MGPFKCPDCGIWWSGLEHRCAPTGASTTWPTYVGDPVPASVLPPQTGCTCPLFKWPIITTGSNQTSYAACPLHPITVWNY